MSDASEEQIIDDFQQRTRGYWTTQQYERVTALLISWADDELGVASEIDRLKVLLEQHLRYSTQRYHIPSINSEAELSHRLTSFVRECALGERDLAIVYYGGHGDNTVVDEAGYPAWRAKLENGPTVEWFPLQRQLGNAHSDVFVLLDCCYTATKISREFENGQFEILAASSSGSRVPKPGRLSFTSVLIRELKKQIDAGKDVPIRWLQTHLWSASTPPALTESPQYFTLVKRDLPTIRLAPLTAKIAPGFAQKQPAASSFALLSISFTEDPTAHQLADWLKSYPPNTVSEVNIEALILRARFLEGLNEKHHPLQGSILGKVSPSAQAEIIDRMSELSNVMKKSKVLTQAEVALADIPGDLRATTLQNLNSKVAEVSESVEKGILLDSNIDLTAAQDDSVVAACEVDQVISLRQRLLSSASIPDRLDLPRGLITWDKRGKGDGQSRLRTGNIKGRPIVAEIFNYQHLTTATSNEPPPHMMTQFRKMVALLCHPKQENFHILPCLGYTHDWASKTLSLIFEVVWDSFDTQISQMNISGTSTRKFGTPLMLSKYMSKQKRVALGVRVKLAASLAKALESFHKVGWVHKSLKSDNIVFLPPDADADAATVLDQPWLFGFEYSRPEDDSTLLQEDHSLSNNAYRHPERWGKPLIKFKKSHDIYSLGIILLELAYWKPIIGFPEMKSSPGRTLVPTKIRDELLGRLRTEGPHVCGQSFADSIVACLTFEEIAAGLDEFGAHSEFSSRIVNRLASIRGI
ncbi:hypothetical protein ACJBU6_01974 [Exserohilum turcicum]